MATVLFISKSGDAVPLAIRLAQEGHIVKVWFKERKAKASLRGFKNPTQIQNSRLNLEQYDLVLADMVGQGDIMEEMRRKGRTVLGGGVFNDAIELDREYGAKIAKTFTQLKQPHTRPCETLEELKEYVDKADRPLVVKPLGNAPTSLTLVSKEPKNLLLKSYIEERGNELVPCIVQDRVEGVEISTEGWFNGKDWVLPFNHTLEKKRFMEGDKGPNTGCMGNVVWVTEGDKLVSAALKPLTPLLRRVGYVGPIDVNCIVAEDGPYFLEWTARFGYDAFWALAELVRMPLFDFLWGIAVGTLKQVPMHQEYAIAVRLSIPPWPHKEEVLGGLQYLDIPEEAMRHVWLSDVALKDGRFVTAGVDGVLGAVSARGTDIREARRRVYRTVKNIVGHPDVQYRADIGEGCDEQIARLKEQGWLA